MGAQASGGDEGAVAEHRKQVLLARALLVIGSFVIICLLFL